MKNHLLASVAAIGLLFGASAAMAGYYNNNTSGAATSVGASGGSQVQTGGGYGGFGLAGTAVSVNGNANTGCGCGNNVDANVSGYSISGGISQGNAATGAGSDFGGSAEAWSNMDGYY